MKKSTRILLIFVSLISTITVLEKTIQIFILK